MGLYLSRFSIAICSIWSYNLINDYIKSYRHNKVIEQCICYSCYNMYSNTRLLLYAGFLSVFPDVYNKLDFKIFE